MWGHHRIDGAQRHMLPVVEQEAEVNRTHRYARPIPIFLALRSGYFDLAFSANSLVLNGFDKMTSSRSLYLK